MSSYDEHVEQVEKTDENLGYHPSKEIRLARRRVWDRYQAMRNDSIRKEAEKDWELGDKMFMQYTEPSDPDDWRANFVLPDGFAAIQADMQEKIDRKSRPLLRPVGSSDKGIAEFSNSIMSYNMDRTNFDFQYYLAKQSAAIRGTAFLYDYYRIDEREVQDATGVKDGVLTYTKKTIIDFDDDYTEWVQNEFIFLDPAADHIDKCKDGIRREILDIHEFKRIYSIKKDFRDVDKVRAGGDLSRTAYFRMAQDLTADDVEILHYYNRALDCYDVLANNILIRKGPIPFKHKELPFTPIYHYIVPGRMYGLGIPKVIYHLTEERRSLRMLNLDRQKMQINKMFLMDDRVDMDDEDMVVRPHGVAEINTNGVPINQVVYPLEYGDVPASYFRTEEILLEDIRRAHGLDDRIQGVNVGGTATEAAILKESSLKRVNLLAQLAELDPIKRIGKLKWSNIQFFYPAPRVERVLKDNKEIENKTYKEITVDGKEFKIEKTAEGETKLAMTDIEGVSTFKLNAKMAKFMEGDFDVVIDAEAHNVLSKPIQQAKTTEMVNLIMNDPLLSQEVEPNKVVRQLLKVNDFSEKDWLKTDKGREQMKEAAEWENRVMAAGNFLSPTKGATIEHTEEHLNYTKTSEFEQLPEETQEIIMQHITGEHDANPATGSVADLMGGAPAPAPDLGGGGLPPQIQPADLSPSTVNGEEPNGNGGDAPIALQ